MIYEYRCIQCGNVFDLLRGVAEANLPGECPACGSTAERQISRNVSAHFKGSGFYATDYAKPKRHEPEA